MNFFLAYFPSNLFYLVTHKKSLKLVERKKREINLFESINVDLLWSTNDTAVLAQRHTLDK